jgi:hypothetical protein
MNSKYSDEIYTITKVNKNTVSLINDKTLEEKHRVKKTDINIIPMNTVVNEYAIENIRKETIQENKYERKIKKSGIDASNIINNKRVRKNIKNI